MSTFECSNRTKRRRIAAEVAKFLYEVENENTTTLVHDSSFVSLTNSMELHTTEAGGVDNSSFEIDNCYTVSALCNDSATDAASDNELIGDCNSYLTCVDSPHNVTLGNSENVIEHNVTSEPLECSDWSYRPVGDSEDEGPEVSCSDDIREQLANWAVADNISQASLNRLLLILKNKVPDLPADARTLLQTQKHEVTRAVAGGEYYYFGIKFWLHSLLNNSSCQSLQCTEDLHLHVNIDGIPLFNSCNMSLWPILGMVRELKGNVFPIAIFCSTTKPSSVDEYLHDFILEMNELHRSGFRHEELIYRITLSSVICDAPARAFLKCIKPHTGYDSCERCIQVGEWCNKVVLPNVSSPLRTDTGFVEGQDPKHHVGVSPFLELDGCNLVSGFPLDYMHLVCLGVVRRLINQWINGPRECKLSSNHVAVISGHLALMKCHIPREFSRKPRSLVDFKHWKATELRFFLLYAGPLCLKGILSREKYTHFLDLSVAIRLLLSPQLCQNYLDYAEQLLKYFVGCVGCLYGKDQLVYNVHSLVHLADDARLYGVLDNVSSFPFESYLGRLKKLVRRPQLPCAQIVRRVKEGSCQLSMTGAGKDDVQFKRPHMEGPLPLSYIGFLQYKQYFGKEFFLSTHTGDNCCIVDGKVGIIKNILVNQAPGSCYAYVVFEDFDNKESFFIDPLDSELLSIYIVDKLSGIHHVISLSNSVTKCVLLPYKSKFIVMPQMHYS